MTLPPSIDRRMLQSYLADHLVGAEGGRARIQRMRSDFADLEIGPGLATIADQIDEEHQHLEELIDRLGLRQPIPLRVVARVGELVGRLKPNGRMLTQAPTTPLLELELMRGAVNAKQGLWQAMAEHSASLGLDREHYLERAENAARQAETLEALHDAVLPHAFSPVGRDALG